MKPHLLLLHFSGGNKYSFNFLKPYLEDSFELHPLELAGRGMRLSEDFNFSLRTATEDLLHQVLKLRLQGSVAIYGHSLGASLGLLLAKRLEVLGTEPLALVVSGHSGPSPEAEALHASFVAMNDQEFAEALKTMGGINDAVLASEELMEFMLPILRADFKMYTAEKAIFAPVRCPIHAIMGTEEKLVHLIDTWANFTTSHFQQTILPGHHFFINDQVAALAEKIKETIALAQSALA